MDPSDKTSIVAVVSNWASQDVQAAVDWFKALPNGELKNSTLQGVMAGWVNQEPEKAANFVLESLDTKSQPELDNCLSGILTLWSASAPEDAIRWVKMLPAGNSRTQLLGATLAGWANVSPTEAASFVATFPAGEERQSILAAVVRQWSISDPQSVANWVESFPAGPDRDSALGSTALVWAFKDPAKAAKWLYAHGAAGQVPPAMGTVLRVWEGEDPEALAAWLKTTSLPEEFKPTSRGNK
jgi:hypothetical protein